MVHTSFNMFDMIVAIIVGLSALLSFYRGFLRELLSLGSWIGAILITLYAFPHVRPYFEAQISDKGIAGGLTALVVFITAFILVCIISGIILKYVKPGQEIGFIDNFIGLTFGIARGVLLVSIGYYMMTILIAEKDYPDWVKKSITRPYVATAANYLAEFAPSYLNSVAKIDVKAPDISIPRPHEDTQVGPSGVNLHQTTPSMEELEKRMREMDEKH